MIRAMGDYMAQQPRRQPASGSPYKNCLSVDELREEHRLIPSQTITIIQSDINVKTSSLENTSESEKT
jgi:hypothetical protein